MQRSSLKEFFGWHYIVNKGTKEVHDTKHVTARCRIGMITKGRYVRNFESWKRKGYNGCRYCMKMQDEG